MLYNAPKFGAILRGVLSSPKNVTGVQTCALPIFQMGISDERGYGGAENFFGDSLFYALQHTKIWSNSERSSHKSDWKVKILPIYIFLLLKVFNKLTEVDNKKHRFSVQ